MTRSAIPLRFGRCVTTIAAVLALSACNPFADDATQDVRAAFEAQDYPSARDGVAAILEGAPNDATALELMARIALAMGQGGDALAALERLEADGNAPDDAALLRAEGLLQQGDTAAALTLLADQESAEGHRLRALAARQMGNDDRAAEHFAAGRSAPGDRSRLFAAEASFHLDRGDLGAAGQAVALANDVAPDRIETLFVTARHAETQGDMVLALARYLRIVEKSPLDRPALMGAIAASEHVGQPGITRHLITYGAETRPFDPEFYYQLARIDAWDGNWEAVRERMQAHEGELQQHGPARLLYAEALLNLGQVETARAMAAPHLAQRNDAEAARLRAALAAAG